MKDFLYKLFCRIFKQNLLERDLVSCAEAIEHARKNDAESKRSIQMVEASLYIDRPVIYFSNEYDNPVVGFVKTVTTVTKANCPMLLVHDYLQNEEVMVHPNWPSLQHYNDQVLQAFCQMDRNLLITFLYGRYRTGDQSDKVQFNKIPHPGFLTVPEMIGRLQQNGFYQRLRAFREQRQAHEQAIRQKALQEN